MSEITATYLIHDAKHNPAKKAEEIALGLTVGSWTHLPELEKDQLRKHKGRVVLVEVISTAEESKEKAAIIQVGYPTANFSPDLQAILTTVFGKLSLDGKIKLIDLQFSEELKSFLPGPRFGIGGIRGNIKDSKKVCN
ncbi:hypothetical protein NCCP133_25650 [Cytobacillus sp. NCCP-133]|nr:hypothetical protein NCCP133_25650 [Cytobacillus sp. NCCP-133]